MNVYLGLGSNKGNKIGYISKAITEIGSVEGIRILKCSSIYETEPWGKSDLDIFLNSVIEIETQITPVELIIILKAIESKLGRSRSQKWEEREIDIDILFYGDIIIEDGSLTIPHAQIENRRFVLVPMNELAPGFIHPKLKKSITDLLNETGDSLQVIKTTLKTDWTK